MAFALSMPAAYLLDFVWMQVVPPLLSLPGSLQFLGVLFAFGLATVTHHVSRVVLGCASI
jgi:hypothetical protein